MLKKSPGEPRYDTNNPDTVDTEILEVLDFEYPNSSTLVQYDTDEFTSVCPWTGLPDFATLRITYVPRKHLIELKALKYYLLSFRNVGILQEHVVNKIQRDLSYLIDPETLKVEAWFRDRGGLRTYAVVETQTKTKEGIEA